MRSEGRTILGLVAAGRISAMEAERLLRVWSDAREEFWILAACLLVWVAQMHLRLSLDGVSQFIEGLMREVLTAWNAALSLLTKGVGGRV